MKNPHDHDHERYLDDNCPACAWEAGAKAGVELAKEGVCIQRSWFDDSFEGLDWSDVDFELERKE